ncbi:MAG: PQQ-binding-like beta-propeller repeat protein [Verrucomicrobia bacterium]|nr:PQQ-binding-like beta-propeller repeat protein [Verrucomicrobiota bacterium]
MLILLCLGTPLRLTAAERTGTLAFQPAAGGEFSFDTGFVRGKLRPQGKTLGLSSVVHIPSGTMLDRGDKGYGLFSHYRVFTANQRYGVGAWDWPSTARLREDGAVEVAWASATNRPFEMRAVYRWTRPDTLDLETIVKAQTDLPRFESFLASYFAGSFTNALAYVGESPLKTGQPKFLAADKAFGLWQMFPRDGGVTGLIQDGRWKLEPNPVSWTLMPPLAKPIGIRRDPASGLTVALMAPAEGCFAIATPFQTEGHYSLYLSLFGRDLKSGETARARARMLIAGGLSEEKIIQSQREIPSAEGALLRQLGVTRGLCVVLGDRSGSTALRLARNSELMVYVQLADAKAVAEARRNAEEAGLYGSRVFIEQGPWTRLYLADNIADALLAIGEAATITEAEALRVLHPEGKAILGERELIKPFPAGIDDWRHPYHGPDNNPVSHDLVARGPYLTQFLADPRYAPVPQVAVASGGRVFKAFGHIAFKAREEPWLNTLAAFNGYNGTLLWRRETPPALMVHRNTLIATPTRVYFGDDQSCKVMDAATGKLLDEIAPPAVEAGGTFWKWMALENGVLYALIGEQEERDPVIRAKSENHGWPWNPLSPGYNKEENTWGFGRTLLAIDPATGRVLWRHQEQEPVDGRALCLRNNRIYAFRFGAYLTCLDTSTGHETWRKTKDNAPDLFRSLGQFSKRQDWRTNWRTTAYLRCSDQALYFAGPVISKLLAVSAADGKVLWEHPYDNYQIVIRDDAIYGLPGQIDKDPARVFEPLTGKVLQEIKLGRRACTRLTSSTDALFCRANGGSTRFDLESKQPQLISPMRPNCHDGVTIANGLLYWWPSVCDCNLTLYGITCLGPAGSFDFSQKAIQSERLEASAGDEETVASVPESPADWPAFRANPSGTMTTTASLPAKASRRWEWTSATSSTPTAPVAVGGLVFLAGSDGIVRALDGATGKPVWTTCTGGAIRYPPAISQDRAFIGSGDGWVYCLEAKTGRLLWRFRAAPVERRIPVYGGLQSTWPVGSGVLVADGVAYAAAGIVNYDGTHVYALDARTGRIRWQNNTSGHLDADARTGVSVQGQMMLADGRLYLAGGNAVSPAIYDLQDGRCLNEPGKLGQRVNNNIPGSFSPRGNELYLVGKRVMVSGKPHYAHPLYPVYDNQVFNKSLLAKSQDRAILWQNNQRLACFPADQPGLEEKVLASWDRPRTLNLKPVWEIQCKDSLALAVGPNAVVVARPSELAAYDLHDGTLLWTQPLPASPGTLLWTQPLPASPVPWGLCATRDGRLVVTLENGQVLCYF